MNFHLLKPRMKRYIIFLFALAACNNAVKTDNNADADTASVETQSQPASNDTVKTTLEGSWQLQPMLASDTAAGKIPILVFDLKSNKFQGNTGCNNMSGSFIASGDSLSFNEQIMMTKMACQGYNEQAFIQSLTKTNHFKIEQGVLQLMQEQTVLSKWIRKDSTIQKKI